MDWYWSILFSCDREEAAELLENGVLNGMFVLGRSMGFIGKVIQIHSLSRRWPLLELWLLCLLRLAVCCIHFLQTSVRRFKWAVEIFAGCHLVRIGNACLGSSYKTIICQTDQNNQSPSLRILHRGNHQCQMCLTSYACYLPIFIYRALSRSEKAQTRPV